MFFELGGSRANVQQVKICKKFVSSIVPFIIFPCNKIYISALKTEITEMLAVYILNFDSGLAQSCSFLHIRPCILFGLTKRENPVLYTIHVQV